VNQGLPIIVLPEVVDAYQQGQKLEIDFEKGEVNLEDKTFNFSPLPDKLMAIFEAKGLVNYIKQLS